MTAPYDKLMAKYREIMLLSTAADLLNWDLNTFMPPQGIVLRSDQLAMLERLHHRMLVSNHLEELLSDSDRVSDSLDEVQTRNVNLIRREHEIALSVPEDLASDLEHQRAITRDAWARAKAARKWKVFEPELRKLVDLTVKHAEATMPARGVSCTFDALIDDWEKGMSHERIGRLLGELTNSIMPLIRKYTDASGNVDATIRGRPVPLDRQREVVRDAVNLIGFDTLTETARGRVDESEHPLTSGYFTDARITVHYYERDPFEALLSGLHEAGHALYDLGANQDWMYQPVGSVASSAIDEAIARFAENILGRSRSFWTYYLPRLNKITNGTYSDVLLDDLLRALNKVEPSKTRVMADELTYHLHIAVRFEIERRLFTGDLEVSELPQIWNDLYDKYLHIRFDHDGEGVMQDVHWSDRYYGYFPSYSLGSLYGGMFLKKLEHDLGSWPEDVENGRPGVVMEWLRDNVQRWGALYDPEELVEKVTGTGLTAEPFIDYLTDKYSALWG